MRARIAGLAMLAGASCGHPRALAMTASGTAAGGLIMLPFLTDCTEQPGSSCGTARLEAGIAGVVVGAAIALLVDKEWPTRAPPPSRPGPVWRSTPQMPPPAGSPLPPTTPPRDGTAAPPTTPPPPSVGFGELVFDVPARARGDAGTSAEGATPPEACAAAKLAAFERAVDFCGDAPIASVDAAGSPCECRVGDSTHATCETRLDATCANRDHISAALGAASAPSRTVAEARAIESLRARCGRFRRKPAAPTGTCACTADGCVCVETAACE